MIRLAWRSLSARKLRSLLTALGVVFGVGSILAMLSIGEGARRDIIAQIRAQGIENLIIQTKRPAPSGGGIRYGLRQKDLEHFTSFDAVKAVVPAQDVEASLFLPSGKKLDAQLTATIPAWPLVHQQPLIEGRFLVFLDGSRGQMVCVVTREAAKRLDLPGVALGEEIRWGRAWLRVVGVVDDYQSLSRVFVPMEVVNRLAGQARRSVELDQIILSVQDPSKVEDAADRVRAYLRGEGRFEEAEVEVPLAKLKQEEAAQRTFQIAMGAIAGISLVVGGVGIMNIMLANVTERIKEIGTRRALGARRRDILWQFLSEALVLTFGGAVLGVGFGIGLAQVVGNYVKWPAVFSPTSVGVAVFCAVLVGLASGTYPANRAAHLDPVEALRGG